MEQLILHQRLIELLSQELILAQELLHQPYLFYCYSEFLLNLGHSLAFQLTNQAIAFVKLGSYFTRPVSLLNVQLLILL